MGEPVSEEEFRRGADLPWTPEEIQASHNRLLRKLQAYEAEHGMTTAEMVEGFKKGTVPDTEWSSRWLILASLLDPV